MLRIWAGQPLLRARGGYVNSISFRAGIGVPLLAVTVLLAGAVAASAQSPQVPLIAQACVGCHGQAGAGSGTVPKIAGLDKDVFLQQWEAFRNKQRPATIMDRVASGYTEAEAAVLADYFSKLKPGG